MFYKFSRGSAYETKNHLIYGNLVKYFELQKTQLIIAQIESLIHDLNKIIKTLESNSRSVLTLYLKLNHTLSLGKKILHFPRN